MAPARLPSPGARPIRKCLWTPQNTVGQTLHLGVATLTGVAPEGIGQGGYLLDGFEHLLAYGTVAPVAASHTVGAALKLIDSATRTDYGVGSGRYIAQLFHCIPFSSTYP